MRVVAIGLVLAVVATGMASAALVKAPSIVTCGSIIDPGGAIEWRPRRVVLGVVAVPPAYIRQTVTSGDSRWPYWSKAGIVVRAESPPVSISVPRRWRQRAAIGWGNVDATAELRIASCPESSSLEGWNPYTGGFQLAARAACVPLTFRVGDRSATVRFGVGKRCG